MASIKGITIEIAGKTSGLVSALKDADKALADTKSALKAVNKALEMDPGNVELIAQKEALLADAVQATKDRLDALKDAAELAKKGLEDGTTTREQYAQLAAEIVTTENSLKELEGEANGSAEAMTKAGDAAKDSGEKWEEFGRVAKAAAEMAVAAIAAVGAAAVAGAKALVDCTVEAAAFADEILTLSKTSGVAADTLQEWSYAAELIDVSLDTMTSALTKTTSALGKVADGNSGTIEMFEQLGVAAYDASGNLRSSEDVFYDIVDALGGISNETERDALAMELLGKSAQDLNPLIEAGSETLRQLGDEAREAGYVMSDDTLEAFGEFDDELQRLKLSGTAAKNALGTVLLPLLNSLASDGVGYLNEFTNAIIDADGDIGQMGEVIGQMLPEVINTILSYLPMFMELAGTIIESIANGILENLDVILSTALDIVVSLCDGILNALPGLIPVVVNIITTLATKLVEMLPTIVDAGIQLLLALIEGLADTIPDLIPTVVDAVMTIASTLIENADEILLAGMDLIVALAEGLVQAVPDMVARIPEIISALIDTLASYSTEFWDLALGWGADLIQAFRDGLNNALPTLIAGLENVAATIASYLHFTSPDVGPLAHDLIGKSGKDMIITFADGIEHEMSTLEGALTDAGNTIANGMTGQVDYSEQLAGISAGVSNMGGQIVIPVYLGGDQIDTVVVDAFNRAVYREGGV